MAAAELRRSPRVSVIGASEPDDAAVLDAARAVGRGLAGLRVVLVTGGLGGTMEAVCEGYRAGDGRLSVGILPGTDRARANPHVDLAIPTGLGHARNLLVALNGDIVVAFPGAGGTLSEVGLSQVFARPVVAYRAWGGLAEGFDVAVAETADEVVERVADRLKRRGQD